MSTDPKRASGDPLRASRSRTAPRADLRRPDDDLDATRAEPRSSSRQSGQHGQAGHGDQRRGNPAGRDDRPQRAGLIDSVNRARERQRHQRVSPFTRLARVQAVSAAGDGCLAVALASSLFLGLDPTAARPKVLLFLVITFIPFLVVSPLIGPFIDRMAGGRRLLMQIIAVLRAVTLLLMAFHVGGKGGEVDILLYPIAFAALVLQKTQSISKSALVPSVVRSEADLVEANSKLGLIAGVFGFVGAAVAGLSRVIAGVPGCLIAGSILFVVAFVYAARLPGEVVAAKKATLEERVELKSAGIALAASAMALLRASVGCCFFLLAFWLKPLKAGTLLVGVAISMVTVGVMIGNAVAPAVRKHLNEENIFLASLGLTAVGGILAALFGGVGTGIVLALVVNFAASLARLAFDSIVQRDAPDANQGRAFAQFETKFQLAWVLGGILPVLYVPKGQTAGALGFAVVGFIALFATVSYLFGTRRVKAGKPIPEPFAKRARRQLAAEMERRKVKREGGTPTAGTSRPRPLPPPSPTATAVRHDPPDAVQRALRGDPLRAPKPRREPR